MAYEFHIRLAAKNEEGERTPLELTDWKSAVAATQGVRLSNAGANTISNPKTQEVISIPRREGDVEVYFPEEGAWHGVFMWFEGASHFKATFDPVETSHPVWAAASALASRLGATIYGDEGEVYDLETGKITNA